MNNGHRIAAASTHPFASWQSQEVTAGIRYKKLLDQMQTVSQQLLIFGYHIHIGFDEMSVHNDLKIEIMSQLRYFLPHILGPEHQLTFLARSQNWIKILP